ncbi:hypothetical protein A7K72_07275, partial [Candidatus Methylacidiphilum fumarolicum]
MFRRTIRQLGYALLLFLVVGLYPAFSQDEGSSSAHPKKKHSKKAAQGDDESNAVEEKNKQIEELTKKLEDQGIPVQANTKGIVLSGYVDASYTYNFINAPAFNRVPGFVPPPGYVGPTNTAGFAQGYPAIPGREPVDAIP